MNGDILGRDLVNVDNIHVEGSVSGRVVKIGPNSKIEGKILYVDDLILADDVVLKEQPGKVTPKELGRGSQSREPIQVKNPSDSVVAHFCPKCGQEVGLGRKFCAACGSQL